MKVYSTVGTGIRGETGIDNVRKGFTRPGLRFIFSIMQCRLSHLLVATYTQSVEVFYSADSWWCRGVTTTKNELIDPPSGKSECHPIL